MRFHLAPNLDTDIQSGWTDLKLLFRSPKGHAFTRRSHLLHEEIFCRQSVLWMATNPSNFLPEFNFICCFIFYSHGSLREQTVWILKYVHTPSSPARCLFLPTPAFSAAAAGCYYKHNKSVCSQKLKCYSWLLCLMAKERPSLFSVECVQTP